MSRAKQVYNIPQQQEQVILKRLLCVALYDYTNLHIQVELENKESITKLLEVLLPNYNVEHIVSWLLEPTNKPTKFEYMLLYNQMKVESVYIKDKLKVASTNIFKWNKSTDILMQLLDNDTLMIVRNILLKINWTKFNYKVFERINFREVSND